MTLRALKKEENKPYKIKFDDHIYTYEIEIDDYCCIDDRQLEWLLKDKKGKILDETIEIIEQEPPKVDDGLGGMLSDINKEEENV